MSFIDDAQNMANLQKTLPTTDLNKKDLSFDKISPRDFYFFPFFSICTCWPFVWGSTGHQLIPLTKGQVSDADCSSQVKIILLS